eukprot:2693164-Prymnesium_polylepis.1
MTPRVYGDTQVDDRGDRRRVAVSQRVSLRLGGCARGGVARTGGACGRGARVRARKRVEGACGLAPHARGF